MSLAELKQKPERRHLPTHLVVLDRKSDPGFKQKLAEKIADKTSGRWIAITDVASLS